MQFVVIGIGINVNNTATQLLPEATSLRFASGAVCSRILLLQEILRRFEQRYLTFLKDGAASVVTDWKNRSATLGCKVRFMDRSDPRVGVAEDLADDGGLLIRMPDGRIIKRVAGDILL